MPTPKTLTTFLAHHYVPRCYDAERRAYVLDHKRRVSAEVPMRLRRDMARHMLAEHARKLAPYAIECGDGYFVFRLPNGSVEGWYLED